MRELISRVSVQGFCRGRQICAQGDPWKISVRPGCRFACELVRETIPAGRTRRVEACVFYDGVRQLAWDRRTLLAVGYELRIRCFDRNDRRETVVRRGSAVLFQPAETGRYFLRMPNPPACRILDGRIIVEFPVAAVFQPPD